MKRNYPGNEVGLFVRSSVMLARFFLLLLFVSLFVYFRLASCLRDCDCSKSVKEVLKFPLVYF